MLVHFMNFKIVTIFGGIDSSFLSEKKWKGRVKFFLRV